MDFPQESHDARSACFFPLIFTKLWDCLYVCVYVFVCWGVRFLKISIQSFGDGVILPFRVARRRGVWEGFVVPVRDKNMVLILYPFVLRHRTEDVVLCKFVSLFFISCIQHWLDFDYITRKGAKFSAQLLYVCHDSVAAWRLSTQKKKIKNALFLILLQWLIWIEIIAREPWPAISQ